MKCFFLYLLVACIVVKGFAQTIDEVKGFVSKGDFANAKKAIDGYMTNEVNAAKADGWYYKGVIYNEYSKKETLATSCPNCKQDAFVALIKYQSLDTKNIYMLTDQNVQLFDLYNGFFDLGSKEYENKSYENAYKYFSNAALVEKYVRSKGFTFNGFAFGELDTSLVQNLALAARLANKKAEAVKYYEQLVAAGLKGDANLEIYQYLAEYYVESQNATALNILLAKGKKLYPKDNYWNEVELDMLAKKDKALLYAKYDELLKSDANNYVLHYNYAVELFNYLYVGENRPADFESKKTTLENVLIKALAINNTADANVLLARSYYNDVYDLQDIIKKTKGTSPEDAKKRTDSKAKALNYADDCIKYAGEAAKIYSTMGNLKPINKSNYKNALGILEAMYGYKGDPKKAAEFKKLQEDLK